MLFKGKNTIFKSVGAVHSFGRLVNTILNSH